MNAKSPINTMNMAAGKDHPIPSTSRGLLLFSNSCSKSDERADNRKNENTEKKKKEEKLKQKAEKDARKVFKISIEFDSVRRCGDIHNLNM